MTQKNDEFLTLYSTHASKKRQKYLFFLKPLSEFNFFFVVLMSSYYNKSNSKGKESSEQYLIEMSILNGVSVQFCFFFFENTKMGRGHSKTKFWWILKNEEKIKDIP